MDLSMMTYFGSRERGEEDWKNILGEADQRFQLRNVVKPGPGANDIIVIEWVPSESTSV